ncbi:ABC transporter permease [Actinopolymorpha rutila]|uniref:Peptide/nickel transport system permease protein n=1 Tax=Actinopolymorpha rutila TaxID=446787 RepID=A0A852ZK91_9ACTN|nr:ABC transporter permease [Actinopolymorpha rutila]NYH92318.1 peptide/nickel transport system permease protein [Actinopolymorpha rutila]
MRQYVVKRLVMAFAIVYFVVSLSFFMIRLMPGNPMSALEAQLQKQGGMSPEEIQQRVQAIYGLTPNEPLGRQYVDYIWNALHGDLGNSISDPGESVVHVIANAAPWTIFIVGSSLVISFVAGIAIGALMAAFQNSAFAKVMTFVVSFLSAVPNYLVAIVLLYLLTDVHHYFPISGAYSVNITPGFSLGFVGSALYHAILPIAAFVITSFGAWSLSMKGTAVSVLGSEYVRAAESRGLSPRRVAQSYVGRNSLLPQVTGLALSVGFLFGGSVFIEFYFSYPGLGYYLINSINSRDYSVMMGCFLLITSSVVLANFVVDLVYPAIDPRIARPGLARRAEEQKESAEETAVVAKAGV